MARRRERSEATFGDQVPVVVVPESETNLGGTGKVASFSSLHEKSFELNFFLCL